jgi:hypothetical protein
MTPARLEQELWRKDRDDGEGCVRLVIVNENGGEHFEVQRMGKLNAVIRFYSSESGGLLSATKRCDELLHGHPKYRADGGVDEILQPRKAGSR